MKKIRTLEEYTRMDPLLDQHSKNLLEVQKTIDKQVNEKNISLEYIAECTAYSIQFIRGFMIQIHIERKNHEFVMDLIDQMSSMMDRIVSINSATIEGFKEIEKRLSKNSDTKKLDAEFKLVLDDFKKLESKINDTRNDVEKLSKYENLIEIFKQKLEQRGAKLD